MTKKELFIKLHNDVSEIIKDTSDEKLSARFVDADTFVRGKLKKSWKINEATNEYSHSQVGSKISINIVIKKVSKKEWTLVSFEKSNISTNENKEGENV